MRLKTLNIVDDIISSKDKEYVEIVGKWHLKLKMKVLNNMIFVVDLKRKLGHSGIIFYCESFLHLGSKSDSLIFNSGVLELSYRFQTWHDDSSNS